MRKVTTVTRVLHSGGHVCLAGKALDSSLTTQKNKNQNTYEETKIQGPERVWESGRSSVLLVPTDHCGKADLVHDPSSAATSRLTHVLQLGETGLYIQHTHPTCICFSSGTKESLASSTAEAEFTNSLPGTETWLPYL